MTSHLSDLTISRLLDRDMPAADAIAVREHVATCARCDSMYRHAIVVQRDFVTLAGPLRLPARRVRRTTLAMGLLAAAAAAMIIVVTWPSQPAPTTSSDGDTRTKGRARIGVYIEHAGQVRQGSSGEHVRAGDRVELVTTSSRAGWFAVTSDDGAGVHSVYVAPRPYEAGADRLVPVAIELDDAPGHEVLEAVFCPTTFDVASPPGDCTRDRIVLVKDTP